ncbi:alpha/beta hydrolase [Kribbella pittospori]|uniref:Alpha/beta hydrolase n=1 Tax=Kribbella pittospori TaxID=722689 RepID=A0A4R0KRN5_9ACTN|nr:alpha/beta hydrolase [Kribbella pittospori]TCC62084.1 alpha/beta hydrolase [Kribbella pittospori]
MGTSYAPSDKVAAAFAPLVDGRCERRELDRGGRVLRWLEAGAGPTVLFEAGAMSPAAGFAAVFKALAPDYRVIFYDRAGYGVSEPAPLSLELQLGDLLAVLGAVGPCVVVGHSWGGLLAQLATWERPELVAGLVLLDPSHEVFWSELLSGDNRHPSRTAPASEDSRAADVLKFGRELAADVARSVGGDERLQRLLIEACLSYLETDEQLFTYLDEFPMILDHVDDLAARRAQGVWPELPVVVLTATKGRPADSTEQVTTVLDQLVATVNGRHTIVPDSGHYMHLDRPDLVVRAVRDVGA